MPLSKKVAERVSTALKRFQPILQNARTKDINESDTVVIVTDVLHDLFGYDKYTDITSEQRISGRYCDLAIKIADRPALLIEVKAIGLDLKDQFVRQAVDYAANQGVDWVVLTNGIRWHIYKVSFTKPIEHELIVPIDLLAMNPKSEDDLEMIGLLAKEGWQKERLGDYHAQKQVLSRFSIAAIVLSDPVVEVTRRELRRLSSGIKIDLDEIRNVLRSDVLKREVLEGDKADEARKLVNRAASRALRTVAAKDDAQGETVLQPVAAPPPPIAPDATGGEESTAR